ELRVLRLRVEQALGREPVEQWLEPTQHVARQRRLRSQRLADLVDMGGEIGRGIAQQRRKGSQGHPHVGTSMYGFLGVRLAPTKRLVLVRPFVPSCRLKPADPRST